MRRNLHHRRWKTERRPPRATSRQTYTDAHRRTAGLHVDADRAARHGDVGVSFHRWKTLARSGDAECSRATRECADWLRRMVRRFGKTSGSDV